MQKMYHVHVTKELIPEFFTPRGVCTECIKGLPPDLELLNVYFLDGRTVEFVFADPEFDANDAWEDVEVQIHIAAIDKPKETSDA